MAKKIFAVTVGARRGIDGVVAKPAAIVSQNEATARGRMLKTAEEIFPSEEGWHSHGAWSMEISMDWIKEVYEDNNLHRL